MDTEIRALEAQLRELDARHRAVLQDDRVKAEIIDEQRNYVQEGLQRARERMDDLTVRAAPKGCFVLPQAEDLPGRFVRKGQQIGHVVEPTRDRTHLVISQQDIDLVRQRCATVEVRLAERRDRSTTLR